MAGAVKMAIVTGGAGFIGRALVTRLCGAGADVVVVDRESQEDLPSGATARVMDLSDVTGLTDVLREHAPDTVFHLAASRQRSSDLATYRPAIETNLMGTLGLIEAIQASASRCRLVAVGTAEEYGAAATPYTEGARELPVSAYSLSKLAMTHLIESYTLVSGFDAVVLRPSVAYGPHQPPDMFISALVTSLVNGEVFPMTAGEQTRDFVYVDDLVDALMRAAVAPEAGGRIVNIGSGISLRLRDVAELASRIAVASGLVRFGEVAYRPGEQMVYELDTTLASQLLGWRATTSLEVGLTRTIDAARSVV